MRKNVCVVDIETTGLLPKKHGLLSIGAATLEGEQTFYSECHYEYCEVSPQALEINGFTLKQIKDLKKPFPGDILKSFVDWCKELNCFLLAGVNIGNFDIQFLKPLAEYHSIDWPFGHRYLEIGSVFFAKHGRLVGCPKMCEAEGIEIVPPFHNALSDALTERNLLRALLEGE